MGKRKQSKGNLLLMRWVKLLKFNQNERNFKKVWDHGQYIGKYRDATHSLCNLQYDEKILYFNGNSQWIWIW